VPTEKPAAPHDTSPLAAADMPATTPGGPDTTGTMARARTAQTKLAIFHFRAGFEEIYFRFTDE